MPADDPFYQTSYYTIKYYAMCYTILCALLYYTRTVKPKKRQVVYVEQHKKKCERRSILQNNSIISIHLIAPPQSAIINMNMDMNMTMAMPIPRHEHQDKHEHVYVGCVYGYSQICNLSSNAIDTQSD